MVAKHDLGRVVLLLLCSVLLGPPLFAQEQVADIVDLLEPEDDAGGEEMIAWLEELLERPLELERATVDEIASLPTITPGLAAALRRVLSSGESRSVAELATQTGADSLQTRVLLLFTRLRVEEESPPLSYEVRTRLSLNLQEESGYRDELIRLVESEQSSSPASFDTVRLGTKNLGPPGSYSTRILGAGRELKFGLVVDRDGGEPLLYHDTLAYSYRQYERVVTSDSLSIDSRSSTGLFVSGHIAGKLGPVEVLLGDYSLSVGSGLQFGRLFGGRKGGSPVRDPIGSSSRAKPWRSRSESGYHRGVLLEGSIDTGPGGVLSGMAFLSRRFHDGAVRESETSPGTFISTIDPSGSLVLRSDLRRDDRIVEHLAGIHLEGAMESGVVGATISQLERFDRGDRRDQMAPLERVNLYGVDARWSLGNGLLFGEAVVGSNKGIAVSAGLSQRIAEIDATLALRHFSPEYRAPYGVSFAESPARPHGESGIYLALRFRPIAKVRTDLFLDLYNQSSRDARRPFPTTGSDLMARFRWRPHSGFLVEALVRSRNNEGQFGSTDLIPTLQRRSASKIVGRLGTEWNSRDRSLRLRLRFEGRRTTFDGSRRTGTLLFADLRWRLMEQLQLQTRWAQFGGSSNPAQVYAVEGSLPGGLSLTTLSGHGKAYYLLLLWKQSEQLTLGAKYRETWYADRNVIRAGSTREISGSLLSTLVLQVDWKFGGED